MLTILGPHPGEASTNVGSNSGQVDGGRERAAPVQREPWAWPLALGVAGVALAQAAAKLGSCQDDAYIYFRYASNAAHGAGLVFNEAERVEGFTSPLWQLVLTATAALGVAPVVASGVLGGLAMTATLLLSVRDARRCGPPWPFAAIAPAALALCAHFVVWSVSGLETSLFTCLLWGAASSYRVARHEGRPVGVGTGCWLAAAALARPEGALAVLVFGGGAVVRAWRGGSPAPREGAVQRAFVAALLPSVGAGVALLAARWEYFHALLPNTYFVKAGGAAQHVRIGLRYLGGFALVTPLAAAIAGLALPADDGRRRVPAAELVLVTLWLVHVVRVGGDYLPYYRFLVPVLPLVFALGAEGVHRAHVAASARVPFARRRPALARGLVAALVLAGVAAAQFDPIQLRAQHGLPLVVGNAKLGRVLGARLPAGATIAAGAIGALGFHSRRRIVDLLGLVDAELAHRPSCIRPDEIRTSEAIGHDHFDVDYSLAKRPDVIVFARAYGSRPFDDLSEVPSELLVERHVLERVAATGGYVVRDVRVDADAWWAVLVRSDEADSLGL